MKLPPIIKDSMDMKINNQLSVTLFPKQIKGAPTFDIISLKFKTVEGNKSEVRMTPCEAMEIVQALSSSVQFYLYNQEQYRKEVLEPRLINARNRRNKAKNV